MFRFLSLGFISSSYSFWLSLQNDSPVFLADPSSKDTLIGVVLRCKLGDIDIRKAMALGFAGVTHIETCSSVFPRAGID
ncbi:hypothetical protein FN846DRAFT_569712 [Sphaerosporella brunnea]|uniref:Uncharacterized protein n=1 Tax=Sphaerosporella brunnea TaxID=1250544 RepID=A0A5J5F3B6_9PEZI|nr:hypothetical protein FN846DRAFT_569712 [Sphaerosporella brunnea]